MHRRYNPPLQATLRPMGAHNDKNDPSFVRASGGAIVVGVQPVALYDATAKALPFTAGPRAPRHGGVGMGKPNEGHATEPANDAAGVGPGTYWNERLQHAMRPRAPAARVVGRPLSRQLASSTSAPPGPGAHDVPSKPPTTSPAGASSVPCFAFARTPYKQPILDAEARHARVMRERSSAAEISRLLTPQGQAQRKHAARDRFRVRDSRLADAHARRAAARAAEDEAQPAYR